MYEAIEYQIGHFLKEYETGRYSAVDKYILPTIGIIKSIIVEPDFVKLPDISFWQGEPDFDVMWTRAKAVVIRAGQNLWIDEQFERNYSKAGALGMSRGVYWFYDGRISPGRQAQLLIDLLKGREPEMEIWIDWEHNFGGGHEGLANVVAMMQAVEAGLPNSKVGMYTGFYWFIENSNATTHVNQYNYLKNKPLWIAWYASANIVRIPAPWLTWVLWQYGTPAVGHEYGVESIEIDMNNFNGNQTVFNTRYGITSTIITYPYPGVTRYDFMMNGVKVYVEIIDMAGKRAKVVYDPNLRTVAKFTEDFGAQIGVNGHAWDLDQPAPHLPQGVCVSDGLVIINERDGSPFLNISPTNQMTMPWNDYSNLYNAISGFRYLVRNGVKQSYLDGTDVQYVELHARSAKGITNDGKLMIVGCEGSTRTSGLTLSMLADVFLMFNVKDAMDSDSGSSFALENRLVGGTDRPVVSALLIFTNEGEQPMAQYDVISTSYNMTLRPEHNTGVLGTESVPAGTIMKADEIWVADADLFKLINGVNVKVNSVGDKWAHVVSVNGVVKNSWVAIIHNGLTYCSYVDTTPTPVISPVVHASMDFDLANKTMTTTRRRLDGTVDVDRDTIA